VADQIGDWLRARPGGAGESDDDWGDGGGPDADDD
jgi:hypothetical protein